MALSAKAILDMLPSLEQYLAVKAHEEMEGEGEDSMEGEGMGETSPETPTETAGTASPPPAGGDKGLGIVIAMKPKGGDERGMSGGKVPGCPDCADGTPHQHVGKS